MKTLYKYVAKEFVFPFFAGLVVFIIFVSIEVLYQLSDIIVQNHVSIWNLFVLLYYYIPQFIGMGVPVGVLLAIFWVLSNFSTRREMMAFQVHGINLKRIVIPFLMIAVVLSGLTYLVTNYVVPSFTEQASNYLEKSVYRTNFPNIQTNTFFRAGNNYFYVSNFNPKTEQFGSVMITTLSGNELTVTYAQSAYFKDEKWYLQNGRIYTLKNDILTFDMSFDTMKLDINQDIAQFLRSQKSAQEMSSSELMDRIKLFQRLGLDAKPFIVELYSRYANSLGALIIAFFGVPFSLFFGIKSKAWSAIITFILVVLYQGSGAWLSAMGKSGMIDPVLSAWLPDIIFAIVGLIFFLLLDSKIIFKLKEILVRILPFAIVILVFGIFSGHAFGAETLKINAGELRIISATEVEYAGGVQLSSNQYTISASSVDIFFNNQRYAVKAIFSGNVIYVQNKNTIYASQMTVFLNEHMSLLTDLRGSVSIKNAAGTPQNVYFFGANSVYDTQSGTTTIYNGYITTCTASPPHYEFAASKIYLVPGDHLIADNIVMYLFGIPIFYFPQYYYSLTGGKQPMQFSINYAGSQGWYTAAQFNFQPSQNFSGDVYANNYTNGPSTYGIDLAGTALNVPYTFSYSNSQTAGLITSQIVQFGVSGTLFNLYSTAFNYQDQITGNTSSQNSNISISGNVLGGSMAAKLTQTVAGTNQSYTLPYQIQNLNTKIGPVNVTGTLSGNSSFAIPGNAFSTSHSLSGNFSWPVKFLTLNSITGSYSDAFGAGTNQPMSYSTFIDATYAFNALNYNFYGLGLNFSYGAMTGFALSSANAQPSDRIALLTNTKLSYNLFGLGLSALYNYTEVTGQNLSTFSTNSFQNNVAFTANYTFPLIPLSAQGQVTYDFNNPTSPLSNVTLTTASNFNLFGVKNALNTSSIISPALKPVNTQVTLNSQYGGVSYQGQTLYTYGTNYTSTSPLTLANQITTNIGNLGFITNLQLSSQFSMNIFPNPSFVWPVPITLSANIPALNLGISAQGNISNWQVQSMTLNFTTGSQCLGLKGTIAFNTQNGFNFSQFTLTVFIVQFPEKSISYDPVTGNFNFSLF
ncbi:MAG: LptF/LptG family permease [Athalassotoga sp.]|uniref:LptF/LptG family permease n=1 Tax=Athalassotoga sp. TaxID=2022597 RepID=UPI003CFFC774